MPRHDLRLYRLPSNLVPILNDRGEWKQTVRHSAAKHKTHHSTAFAVQKIHFAVRTQCHDEMFLFS